MFAEYGTDLTGYDLGAMADDVFADLLESQKLLHEKRIAEVARILNSNNTGSGVRGKL